MSQSVAKVRTGEGRAVYQVSASRKRSLAGKKAFCAVILYFLSHGLDLLGKKDERVKEELDTWEEGFTWGIDMGEGAPSLFMEKTEKGLSRFHGEPSDVDLKITFKSVDSAFLVLSGQVGVAGAYARHGFVLKGDIARAMSVVRCMDLAEAYLFPKLISKKILKEVPEKGMGLLRTYLSLCGHIVPGRA